MYYIYILKSEINGKYYIGSTNNIEDRIKRHNTGQSKYTSKYKPWKLIYSETYQNRSEACKRELEIKKYKGGIQFKNLLGL